MATVTAFGLRNWSPFHHLAPPHDLLAETNISTSANGLVRAVHTNAPDANDGLLNSAYRRTQRRLTAPAFSLERHNSADEAKNFAVPHCIPSLVQENNFKIDLQYIVTSSGISKNQRSP
jgi:hypothetical protein